MRQCVVFKNYLPLRIPSILTNQWSQFSVQEIVWTVWPPVGPSQTRMNEQHFHHAHYLILQK